MLNCALTPSISTKYSMHVQSVSPGLVLRPTCTHANRRPAGAAPRRVMWSSASSPRDLGGGAGGWAREIVRSLLSGKQMPVGGRPAREETEMPHESGTHHGWMTWFPPREHFQMIRFAACGVNAWGAGPCANKRSPTCLQIILTAGQVNTRMMPE
jgi:hypothetical protein